MKRGRAALPLASITRAPSALCRASTSAVRHRSAIRSSSSTTAPSDGTSSAAFIVTRQPLLMMMRSLMAVPAAHGCSRALASSRCLACHFPCHVSLLCDVENLPSEDSAFTERVQRVLDPFEGVAPRDGHTHGAAGDERYGVV